MNRDDVRLIVVGTRQPTDVRPLEHLQAVGRAQFANEHGIGWSIARSAFCVNRAGEASEQDLPDSVRATIERKIERFEESSRKLLLAASVPPRREATGTAAPARVCS